MGLVLLGATASSVIVYPILSGGLGILTGFLLAKAAFDSERESLALERKQD